jgi:hypothetical protein
LSFTVLDATTIAAVSPAGLGNVIVTVTSAAGTSPTSPAALFSYVGTPAVSGISPTAGPLDGGTVVKITGTGFSGATAVNFGSNPATAFTVVSDTSITAVSPPVNSGAAANVTVTTPGGTSTTTAADVFTYGPTVSGLGPSAGPVAGGTLVTITGAGFTSPAMVNFGPNPAKDVTFVNATTLMALSPMAASIGTVPVTVTTPNGTSSPSAAGSFTYVAAPVVAGIRPAAGPITGGTLVTITGTNLAGATAVNYGTAAVTSLVSDTATQIVVISPAVKDPGAVNVAVTTPGGTSALSPADLFLYFSNATVAPAVQGISPTIGLPVGGTMVTITGTGFGPNSPTVVDFGATPATGITIVSTTEITADSPPGTGAVHVTVTTVNGSSSTTAADVFTYSTDGPRVANVQRFGVHTQPTLIVISFDSTLDPIPARNVNNYVIVGPGKRRIKVRSANYRSADHTVTLALAQRLSLRKTYMLTINGTASSGLKNPAGLFLDGQGNGQPGSDSVTWITSGSLATPAALAGFRSRSRPPSPAT